jgi:hypothetical protein
MQKKKPYLNQTSNKKAIRTTAIQIINKSIKTIVKAAAKAGAKATY